MNLSKSIISVSQLALDNVFRQREASGQLYALGNLRLLENQGIGICGSRNASAEALEYAYRFGLEAARKGQAVISGYARGIDRQAHRGALEAGGSTIAVLAEGVNSFRIVKELRGLITNNNFLVLSMYEPDATWQTWRAMDRNRLIVGLSAGLFVIEARETGGTINVAMEAVRQKKPLWAVAYSKDADGREGNRKLIQESAIPLKRLGDVRRALDEAASTSSVKQLAMALP